MSQLHLHRTYVVVGFEIIRKRLGGLLEVAQTPSRIILCHAFQSLAILILRFAGDLQLSYGNRVAVSASFRQVGGPQVNHKLGGGAVELCAGSGGLVARLVNNDLVCAGRKAPNFKVPLNVRKDAAEYSGDARF